MNKLNKTFKRLLLVILCLSFSQLTHAVTKQLYFNNITGGASPYAGDLTRDLTATVKSTKTLSQGDVVTLTQTPAFQAPFTITGSPTISIFLTLQKVGGNSGGGSKTVKVDLYNTGVLIGSLTKSLVNFNKLYEEFLIPVAGDVNFLAGESISVDVTHVNGNDFKFHSQQGGDLSMVVMQTNTAINLDSVGIHAFPYTDPSAATEYLSYLAGTTVYLRATVSDPFGFADISSVDISVNDPGSPPSVFTSNLTTPEVGSDVGAIAVFETPYTIPAAPAPDGVWSVDFVANEGTEGTVSHSINKTFGVGSPALNVKKTISTDYDPVNLNSFPKAIPNSHIEYTIETTNSGFGYADNNSVSITDPIPAAQTTFYFGNPIDPVRFVDGAIPSGLSLTFLGLADQTDDIDFYSDAACTTIILVPQADASGYDISSPKVSCIGINPKGDFNGAEDLINFPSFDVKFTVRLD